MGSTLLFLALFYKKGPGFNISIYTGFLIFSYLLIHPAALRNMNSGLAITVFGMAGTWFWIAWQFMDLAYTDTILYADGIFYLFHKN